MISKQMVAWGESGSSIREIAAYGERRAAEIGPENVYNFAIGNPSIDPPDCVQEARPEPLPVAEELASISDLSAYFDPALLEASFADAPTHDASVPQDAPATAVDETVALQVFEWLEDDAGAGEADAATAAATGTASGFSGAPQDEAATWAAQDGTRNGQTARLPARKP